MRKPIIGLTPSVDEEKKIQMVQPGYLESLDQAGAIGLMLPLTDRDEDIARYVELCDGFLFVGGHPMAGTHFSGFKYSRANMFQGAPMVLVPPKFDDIELFERIKEALKPCNFGRFSITTAEAHDKMIAFTSQMPHIVSNAYIKSPTALGHKGFSAGSYKDLTRVAWLNANMWAELFLSNKENVLYELDTFIDSLQKYRDALINENEDVLIALLDEGRMLKQEVDG